MTKNNILLSDRMSLFYWISIAAIFLFGLISPRTVAYFPAIVGLGSFIYIYFSYKKTICPPKMEIILFFSVCLLAFISAFWAPDQIFSLEKTGKIALILLPGLLFIMFSRNISKLSNIPLLKIFIGIQIFASIFFTSELLTEHRITEYILNNPIPFFKFNRSHIVFSFLTIAVLFLIQTSDKEKKEKIFLFTLSFLSALILLYFTRSQTAQLTFLTGLFFMFIFPLKNTLYLKLLTGGIVAFMFIFPFTIQPIKNSLSEDYFQSGILQEASIMHRFEIWEHVTQQIFKSPIYGQGIESLRFLKSDTWMTYQRGNDALHAHNSVLQVWVEFGIIGIVLGLFFLSYILRQIHKVEDINIKRLYLAIFMACFICALTGYGLWQSWQLGFFMFMAGITIALGNNYKDLGSKNQ